MMAPERTAGVLQQIGNTPLLPLRRISAGFRGVKIFAKAEWHNPGGSVKDRAARGIVLGALRDGSLGGGKTLIDSTSGNTGIAYAMLGAALKIPVELVMPENVSEERRRMVLAYGASVRYTDGLLGSDGALQECKRLAESHPERYFYANQYGNPENWKAHYRTTGKEIWNQTRGRLTHFVAGLGTTGTLMGTGRRLKQYHKQIQVVSVEPSGPLHGLEGLKHMASSIVPAIYDPAFPDEKMYVESEEAYEMVRLLAREEGLLIGFSSGAALAAAMRTARRLRRGQIVVLFPDKGDRYVRTTIWENEIAGPFKR